MQSKLFDSTGASSSVTEADALFCRMAVARRFAPLASNVLQHPPVLGVIFDLDGTLIMPQTWMFRRMREVLRIDRSTDILEHIQSLPRLESEAAMKSIQDIEEEAMLQMRAREGLADCLLGLKANGVRVALCTRNFARPVDFFLKKVVAEQLGLEASFSPIVDRSFYPPKPRGEPLLHIIKHWGLEAKNVIMVGDSQDDMLAGRRAGCATVLIGESEMDENLVDQRVGGLLELMDSLKQGFEGKEVQWNE